MPKISIADINFVAADCRKAYCTLKSKWYTILDYDFSRSSNTNADFKSSRSVIGPTFDMKIKFDFF